MERLADWAELAAPYTDAASGWAERLWSGNEPEAATSLTVVGVFLGFLVLSALLARFFRAPVFLPREDSQLRAQVPAVAYESTLVQDTFIESTASPSEDLEASPVSSPRPASPRRRSASPRVHKPVLFSVQRDTHLKTSLLKLSHHCRQRPRDHLHAAVW